MNLFVYDRREWSLFAFLTLFLAFALSISMIYIKNGEKVFFMVLRSPSFSLSFSLIALMLLTARASIRITLARRERELKVQVGYFPFARRTILLDDIVRIERTHIPWYKVKTVKGWFVSTERYTASNGEAFLVQVKKGKPCVIQTRYREEIFKVIKQIVPEVEIV